MKNLKRLNQIIVICLTLTIALLIKTSLFASPTYTTDTKTVYAKQNLVAYTTPSTASTYAKYYKGDSFKRVAIGSNGWDKVTISNHVVYIKSSLLTNTKVNQTVYKAYKTNMYIKEPYIKLRTTAKSSSAVVKSTTYSMKIVRIGTSTNGWSRVKCSDGTLGYVKTSKITSKKPGTWYTVTAQNKTRYFNAKSSLYSKPNGKVVYTFAKGTTVYLIAIGNNGWDKVRWGYETLYIKHSKLTITNPLVTQKELTDLENKIAKHVINTRVNDGYAKLKQDTASNIAKAVKLFSDVNNTLTLDQCLAKYSVTEGYYFAYSTLSYYTTSSFSDNVQRINYTPFLNESTHIVVSASPSASSMYRVTIMLYADKTSSANPVKLLSVINGNTINVSIHGKSFNVKLIGIKDGSASKEQLKSVLLDYCPLNEIYLSRDTKEVDSDGNQLRYVWMQQLSNSDMNKYPTYSINYLMFYYHYATFYSDGVNTKFDSIFGTIKD